MNESHEHEWHEFPWTEVSAVPQGPHKQLKLYADANILKPIIDELRAAGLVVYSVTEAGLGSHPDKSILQRARRASHVLLTMDRDFWDDRKHPLQKSPGIIFIDVAPGKLDKAIEGLAKFYRLFANAYSIRLVARNQS